ncbi:hypothetical protein FGG08_004036 [Glutinoglossum americanum]|uniref:RBR-type E3 ubiquitin transferase n=1 Tax=Glutinoglossum americanum TaxID=1670608 RepID=A0A9P8HX55_9PEZI|nr:hypothetical protein FGG08_004036 [Glutinoglossum americanum]
MAASCAALTLRTINNTGTAITSGSSITSDIHAIGIELYRVRGLLTQDPRPAVHEEWEEQRRLPRQNEEYRAAQRWTSTNPAAPDSPVEPAELGSRVDEWRQSELPEKELALVEVGTPQEIRRIIRESLAKQLAAGGVSLRDPLSKLGFEEFEPGHSSLSTDPTDGDHPALASSSDSQHIRQDSGSSNSSASSEVQSNGSSIRNPGLTPSTSRSSTSSRGSQSRYPKAPVQKAEASSSGSLWFIPYFNSLPANSKITGPRLTSPGAAQIKKFWKERMSEGTALMDESYFPPKCCLTEIPVKVIQGHLSFTQKALYKRKAREYAVPAGDRLFCPYPSCSRWNPPSKTAVKFNMIRCKYCRRKICFICKGKAHNAGTDCPQDSALEATLRQAHRSGWRRCYQCKNMVEKQSGCIHITCKCKAQFCYTCGVQWKTCACTEEDEVNRHQALQQQADQEDEEAAEGAAAIAAVERHEREEIEQAIARAEEEAREATRREEECQREEKLQLERERRQRRETEERIGRIENQRLRATARELEGLWIAFHRVHRMQRSVLLQHHNETDAKLAADTREAESARSKTYSSQDAAIKTQHSQFTRNLQATHTTALRALQTRHLQEEDAYFASLHARLQGEPNRDLHEYAVVAEMRRAHAEARDKLITQQDAELSSAGTAYKQRLREKRNSAAVAMEAEVEKEKETLERQRVRHAADLRWFDHLFDIRARMLEDLEAQMVSPPSTPAEAATGGKVAV